MEKDFLGLNSKETAVVKEEVKDDVDEGLSNDSGNQWPFPNKFSSLPHVMPINAAQEEIIQKLERETVVSATYVPGTTADAYRQFRKHSTGQLQMSPVSNQAIPAPVSFPFFKNHFPSTSENMAGTSMKQELMGSTLRVSLPTNGTTAGITRPWDTFRSSGSPPQLTIFYAGSVCVYDGISPEKVEAIMCLAGNGSDSASTKSNPEPLAEETTLKLAAADGITPSSHVVVPPSSTISSPISLSSQSGAHSGSGSTSTVELVAIKPIGLPSSLVSKVDPPKLTNGMGPVSGITMMPSAVPQARKASLARFLEKRKERVMSAVPYNSTKMSPKCAEPDSRGSNVCTTSAAGP